MRYFKRRNHGHQFHSPVSPPHRYADYNNDSLTIVPNWISCIVQSKSVILRFIDLGALVSIWYQSSTLATGLRLHQSKRDNAAAQTMWDTRIARYSWYKVEVSFISQMAPYRLPFPLERIG